MAVSEMLTQCGRVSETCRFQTETGVPCRLSARGRWCRRRKSYVETVFGSLLHSCV